MAAGPNLYTSSSESALDNKQTIIKFATLADLNTAISRGQAADWESGQEIVVSAEPYGFSRVWNGSNALTVVLPNYNTIILSASSNTILSTSGTPSGGNDGDYSWDKASSILYGPKSTTWKEFKVLSISSNHSISASLSNWFRGSLSGANIYVIGDSTSDQLFTVAGVLTYANARYITEALSPLNGVTINNLGSNGNSLLNFLNNSPSNYGLQDVITAIQAANTKALIVFSYGINDVRLQASAPTQSALTDRIKNAVNTFLANLPDVDIILRVPNSFLSTDPTVSGLVVPLEWAQSATDLLRNAYLSLTNYWPNVVVLDQQKDIFPSVCPATSSDMSDILHPTAAGYKKVWDAIALAAGKYRYLDKGRSLKEINADYLNCGANYPDATLNTDYFDLIAKGQYVGQGSGYLDFAGDQKSLGNFRKGDIVNQNGNAAFIFKGSATTSGANIRLQSLGTGIPTYAQSGGEVEVYRSKHAGILAAVPYISSKQYPFQVRLSGESGAASGYIRATPATGENPNKLCGLLTTDILLHPVLGAVTMTGYTFPEYSNSGITITKSAVDFTFPTGSYEFFIVGTTDRVIETHPITLNVDGTLSTANYLRNVSKGGIYKNCKASLATQGSTDTTIVVKRGATTVLTITLAATTGTQTNSWATGSQFITRNDTAFTFEVTAGTGAAGLSIVIAP